MNNQDLNAGGFRIQIETMKAGDSLQTAEALTPEQIGQKISAIIRGAFFFNENKPLSLIIEACNEVFEMQESTIRIVDDNQNSTGNPEDYQRNYWVEIPAEG